MRTLLKYNTGIFVIAILLITMVTHVSSQSVVTDANANNTMVLHVESEEELAVPSKIVLVYDSDIITLESTSSVARSYKSSIKSASVFTFNMKSALASALAVDIEREIEVEDWMLSPFTAENQSAVYGDMAEEEEMVIELWMTDLKLWDN